jgi:sugar/nucleoside kinase (ribokinase family)
MDAPDPEFGTVMAKTLAKVQAMGVKTSMDIVSEDSPRAGDIIRSSLKYCNYLIINEQEASVAAEIAVRDADERLIKENMRPICEKLFKLGVKDIVTIHSPEGGFAMDADGAYYEQKSFSLPEGFIVGKTGAGDAFCAGMLYGIYHGWGLKEAMRFGNGVAASSMMGSGGTTAVRSKSGVEELMSELEAKAF